MRQTTFPSSMRLTQQEAASVHVLDILISEKHAAVRPPTPPPPLLFSVLPILILLIGPMPAVL